MLSRAAYAPRICLRCRLQVPLRSFHHAPVLRSSPEAARPQDESEPASERIAVSETPNRDRGQIDVPESRKPAESDNEPPGPAGRHDASSQAFSASERQPPPSQMKNVEDLTWHYSNPRSKVQKQLDKHLRRKGVAVNTPKLSMDFLGKPGHTIVLRDAPRQEPRKPIHDLNDGPTEDIEMESTDMVQGKVESSESRRNIDELRPKHEGVLLEKQVNALIEVLEAGFTSAQLEDYISTFRKSADTSADKGPGTNDPGADSEQDSRVQLQQAWKPLDQGKPDLTTKMRQAQTVVRECWQLSGVEEPHQIGTLRLKLRRDVGKLLEMHSKYRETIESIVGMTGYMSWMGEHAEVTGTKSQCETAHDELRQFARSVKREEISLELSRLHSQDIEHLSRLTKGVITQDRYHPEKFMVSWIDLGDRPSTVESVKDVICRLVYPTTKSSYTGSAALESPPSKVAVNESRHTLTSYPVSRPGIMPWFVQYQGDYRQLAWDQQNCNWWRLAYPTRTRRARDTADSAALDYDISHKVLKHPLVPSKDTVDLTPDGWLPRVETTTATFGNILFGRSADRIRPKHQVFNSLAKQTGSAEIHLPRDASLQDMAQIFSPVSPPLPALASLQSVTSPDDITPRKSTLIIRFIAHPDCEAKSILPTLELRLGLGAAPAGPLSWSQTPKRLLAFSAHDVTKVQLPAASVDVALAQSHYWELAPDALAAASELRNFFELSRLEPSARVFLTPPDLALTLPQEVLVPQPEDGPRIHTPASMRYIVSDLELHHAVEMPFQRHLLRYATVDARPYRGRRVELSLTALSRIGVGIAPDEDLKAEYLEKVLMVAHGRYFPWAGSRPDPGNEGPDLE